jgi:serine/threonine-protein kinase RsbW
MPQATFASKLSEVPPVLKRIMEDVVRAGFPDECRFAIQLALDEALVNAARHGNKLDPSKTVHAAWSFDDKQFRISIEDQGPGFDPDALPDPTAEENLACPHGRGVMLMRAYMTEVSFNKRGNKVTMIKLRDCTRPHTDDE